MISSRATVWSAKTQAPNGLRVTLIKKRNLQHDCSIGDREATEPPAPAWHSGPRWTIESNRDPCKLTIKRRKTFESSDGNLEIRLPEGRSLKARTVASTKLQQDSESSLARIKNWCTEQISASLPSTCYDNFLAADVTMQPSPKCIMLETSLSGELFHLQPSPKDSGIDVSSPPRRFDEVHVADLNAHSAAGVPSADTSVASINATVSRKPSRANIRCEKSFCMKPQTLETMEGMSAKDINVKRACSSSSQRPWNLCRRQSHSRKLSSGMSPVEEDNRLLLRLPTSAFKAELMGTANKTIDRNQMDEVQETVISNIAADCAIKMIPKCKFVENKETDENIGNHCESKFANSVSGHKIRSKTVKQKRLRTVQGADLRVNDNLKEGNLITSKNGKVTKKNIVASAKFDDTNEKQAAVDQSDKNMYILDGDYSVTGTKAPRNMKTYSRNASKQAGNKNKLSNNKTLKSIGAVTEIEEITDGHAPGIFNNGRNAESGLFSDRHSNITDGKCLNFSDGVGTKVGFRLSLRNKSFSGIGVDISGESPLAASVVKVNCHDVAAKTVESVSVGEHFSRTSFDLDDSVMKERSSEKFIIKKSSRLAVDTAVSTKINCMDEDRLTVELSLKGGGCLDKTECVTVHEVIKTGMSVQTTGLTALGYASSTSSESVQLCSKRFTRSSANKLPVIFNSEIPASEPKLKDPTHPLDVSVLNVASRSLTDVQCETRKQPLCSGLDDSANSKADAIATDGLRMHADFGVNSFELESDKIVLDAFSNERAKRSNLACLVKKRRAGSRNSASRRSFERLSNSKELWKLPAEESLSTSAGSKTRNENADQKDIVSLDFERLNRIENNVDNVLQNSGNREDEMESSEFSRFSAKKSSKGELSSEISLGEEAKALNRQNVATCFSSSFKVSSSQEVTRPRSESLSLQDVEATVGSENQFQSVVVPLELSSSTGAALSPKPDLKPNSVSIPTNNYIGEFAKFVNVQHLNSFDSCSSEDGLDFCTSAVAGKESPLFPFEEDLLLETQRRSSSSFCQSSFCEAEPQFNDDLPNRNSVRLCLQGSDLVKHEFDSTRSCSSGECVVLSEDDRSADCVSTKNTEDLEMSSFSFQTNRSDAIGSFRLHSGSTCGISVESLISENFRTDSVVSIDRGLTSLQSKVARLIRAVFPGLSQVHKEQHFLALPQFLNQVLDAVLGDADTDTQLQECRCDCQVNLCRDPLNCLKRLQSKVLRLIRFLLPSSDFEDVGADAIEPLVEAVTLANSARLEVPESLGDDSECCVCDALYNSS